LIRDQRRGFLKIFAQIILSGLSVETLIFF